MGANRGKLPAKSGIDRLEAGTLSDPAAQEWLDRWWYQFEEVYRRIRQGFSKIGDEVTTDDLVLPTFTEGSIIFVGPDGHLAEDNDKLFFDDANDYVGIQTNTPSYGLDCNSTARTDDLLTLGNGVFWEEFTEMPAVVMYGKVIRFTGTSSQHGGRTFQDRLFLGREI